mmetsp:Transcript_347/g.622  ORF Transcript_347/g.622 Transcript_347/m.622 type:complete len:265 (-) Transcript_347:233-1027(-)
MFALPPLTVKWLSITVVQVLLCASTYSAERLDPSPYSKFAPIAKAGKKMGPSIPSRIGMLIIYSPALVLAWLQCLVPGAWGTASVPGLVSVMLCIHFLKRVLEVLLLHRYSGGMPSGMACMIGVFYSLGALLVNAAVRTEAAGHTATGPPGLAAWLGALVFAVGQAGNFYHHWLLARLRKDGAKSTGYAVPQGGLFPCVNSPHYLFELVAWYGIAVAASQLNVLLLAVSTTGYLAGRSVSATEWYRKTIQGFPASRRNLVPFLF